LSTSAILVFGLIRKQAGNGWRNVFSISFKFSGSKIPCSYHNKVKSEKMTRLYRNLLNDSYQVIG
jgi:hypothetical protein